LINTPEFQIFARPTGDVEKLLAAAAKPQTWEIVEKMQEHLDIQDHFYDPIQKGEFDQVCKDFQEYAR